MPNLASTLTEMLWQRAERDPSRMAYGFLGSAGELSSSLTYGELLARARAIAAALAEICTPGDRALLAYHTDPEFIAAFLGCLWARVVAVPVQPVTHRRQFGRLARVAGHARCRAVLAPSASLDSLRTCLGEMSGLTFLGTDEVPSAAATTSGWRDATIDEVAYLQYTSGSTAEPRGVMITHGNVLYNFDYIDRDFRHDEHSVGITWLPHYHDMGLIYGLLQPLHGGYRCYVLSPAAFSQRPLTWLDAISRYGGTHTGGPNFAYDLCRTKIDPASRVGLDLRSWRIAFNGAETIRHASLRAFADAFEPCGFRRTAFYPAYGLAEATLKVSGGAWRDDRDRTSAPSSSLVPCGSATDGTEVAIVNPETATMCREGDVGEIWVRGPSVAAGYWLAPAETERTFRARLAERGDATYLRTGDLGFVRNGELWIVGRLKELLIIRGQNHYPQDLELSARGAHAATADRPSAAFAVERDDDECLVIVQEIERHVPGDGPAIADAMRAAVSAEHGVQIYAIVLVAPGTVPRTGSGKIQRLLCRDRYKAGEIPTEFESVLQDAAAPTRSTVASADGADAAARTALDLVGRCLRTALSPESLVRSLGALGLDSLGMMDLRNRLETEFGVVLSGTEALGALTIADIAGRILRATAGERDAIPDVPALGEAETRLSLDQERLWLMDRLSAGSSAYTLALALRLRGRLDREALDRALTETERRHEMLRVRFDDSDDGPRQLVRPPREWRLDGLDLSGLDPTRREEDAARAASSTVNRGFDLAAGDLFRAALVKLAGDDHLLVLAMHHMVADIWSMWIIVREIGMQYRAGVTGEPIALPQPALRYAHHVQRERDALAQGALAEACAWWTRHLEDAPAGLALPYDRPRGRTWSHPSRDVPVSIDREGWDTLTAAARRAECTPFAILLAACYAWLHRLTGERDLVVGVPVLNRQAAGFAHVVGFFAHPIPLRLRLAPDMRVDAVIQQAHALVRDGVARSHVPLATIVEAAAPARVSTHVPLMPVLIGFMPDVPALDLPGLEVEAHDVPSDALDFDLFLELREGVGGLRGRLRYRVDAFDEDTAAAMGDAWRDAVAQMVARPDRRLSDLELPTRDRGADRPVPLAVAATFAAEPLLDVLQFWRQETGWAIAPAFAPAGQVLQQLVEPTSLLGTNTGGINVVLVRLSDWATDTLDANVQSFIAAVRGAAARGCPETLVVLCPSGAAAGAVTGDAEASIDALGATIVRELGDVPSVDVIRGDEIAATYQVRDVEDPIGARLASLAFTEAFYAALGTVIVRRVAARRRQAVKVIVCDCDNTLWRGVCGEDGAERLVLTADRRRLHECLLAQRNAGVLLCLVSKNHEQDVADVFSRRRDLPLTWSHVAAHRINWRPKSENLRDLARELGLGLESFVFLDDDATECAEVAAGCAEVRVLQLPADERAIPAFLDHQWVFDHPPATAEAARRGALYEEQMVRERHRAGVGSLAEFVESLRVEVRIDRLRAEHVDRASELTYRVNQFHLAVTRLSQSELIARLNEGAVDGCLVSATDRFGDYGQIGLVLFHEDGDELIVPTFAVSCRALGRGIEHRIVAALGDIAEQRGLPFVTLLYAPAPRNVPAFEFLATLPAARDDRGGVRFRLATAAARAVRYAPPPAQACRVGDEPVMAIDRGRRHTDRPVRDDLRTGQAIVDAMRRAGHRLRGDQRRPYVAPRTPTERTVARIWADLLALDRVGVHDDFFELGGHSLRAMQVLARVREAFGVEPAVRVFFDGEATVERLAQTIEEIEIAEADPDRIAALLREVDQLSADRRRELLDH